ncbi:MAG: ABC transporter permease subunit [Ilumatobacter sp.]|nr:ABC transporter permease subunit [Ilumatobacter sp.]
MFERILRLAIVLAVLGALYIAFWRLRGAARRNADAPPPWRDTRILVIAAQVAAIGLIWSAADYLWANFRARTEAIGLELNFDFLDQPSGISIADSPLNPNAAIRQALLTGVKNTFLIIIVGIPLAVILGTLLGVARLSTNWLLSKIATVYVEFFRNIPVLLVIVGTWTIILNAFPPERESWLPFGGSFIFNNKRFAGPSIEGGDNFGAFQVVVVIALLVAAAVWIWRSRIFDRTGHPHHRVLYALGSFVAITGVAYLVLSRPFEVTTPEVVDRVYIGGLKMIMPYAAVMIGLVLYTASHIAEIVRGSILSVPKGQVEAGNALALTGFQRYRFVVLPQAFRVAFPPLINQFLNFTKNSSLAFAVGFAEITGVIQNLFGQSRPAPQLLFILMITYLTFSLVLSAIGNLINKRLQIVGR